LCEKEYATALAYSFLEDLKKEFITLYGQEVFTVERNFAFIKFDTFIQKTRRVFADTRTKRNIQKLKEELGDVHQIMRKNVEEVIGRADKLDEMNRMSNSLLADAKDLKSGATKLNQMYFWRTYGPIIVVVFIVLLVLLARYWFF